MTEIKKSTDKVRASRDGHEYHEAWAARKTMQLLLPNNDLVGIAVEGLAPGDQTQASSETVEIADLTLYYGTHPTFEDATKVEILQFKYSISRANIVFRASDAKKTVAKFVAAYREYKKNYGIEETNRKLRFEIVTNRPIDAAFLEAIEGLASGGTLSGDALKQATQFKKVAGLDGAALAEFGRRIRITGLTGDLADTQRGLSLMLVDWSATSDAQAWARLGDMRQMVRNKAGHAGANNNVIRLTDVLAALQIDDERDLLPFPAVLADVGEIVEREQLQEVIALVPKLSLPLLIHSAGGVGKTVFMQSLAASLRGEYKTVFFDCFGGGAYRSPEDARHLPKNGLVHIANSLACEGLCDPILPRSEDVQSLLRTFRRRLVQCVGTLSAASRAKGLLLFIDAMDNAAEHARDMGQDAFPTLLVESLRAEPVPGVTLILSSRTERVPTNSSMYHDFKLEPFTLSETEAYLRARLPDVKEVEIRVAHARSGGNARILEYLLKSDRGLLDKSEINKQIELDELILGRIEEALQVADVRGHKAKDADAFLAGLAVLPPPVPLDEYAAAHGMTLSAIESFASDLWPLLERTKHGLIFRDEPTETLVRQKYASRKTVLREVASNLQARQDRSVYAARALPGLLQTIGDGDQLFDLAFDDRFPVESTVGQRNIRYARIKAAVRHTASQQDHDRLVHLLVELSTIAAVDQRGADYILEAPDLVIAARDVDATRRLFETRTSWQGARHARLAIANALSGDTDEASRHAVRTEEWLTHYLQQDRKEHFNEPGPESLDAASTPFILCTHKRFKDAVGNMRRWREWYAYEVGEHLLRLLHYAEMELSSSLIDAYLDHMPENISGPAAALSFLEIEDERAKELIRKLAKACKKTTKVDFNESFGRQRRSDLADGLRKAAGLALFFGSPEEALSISRHAPHQRPSMWSFRDHFPGGQVFTFLVHTALTAAAKSTEVREKDLMPSDLVGISKGMKNNLEGEAFQRDFMARLERHLRVNKKNFDPKTHEISYEQKSEAGQFLSDRLAQLLTLTRGLAALLGAPSGKADKPFKALLDSWEKTASLRERYGTREFSFFFQTLGRQMATLGLSVRRDLKSASVKAYLRHLRKQNIIDPSLFIEVVSILAKRTDLEELAGEQAMKTKNLIDREDDVAYRAKLYADLARSILPASVPDAAAYFNAGLEQLDAIGSGDQEFTNELLLFASSLKGQELEEDGFHTLTNICELNLPEESDKFSWLAFGKALSRTSGCRGLAKLSRWDDRAKVPLEYSLLPYLTALLEDGKIEPEDALALNRLADPAEFFVCNTATLGSTIDSMRHANEKALVAELIEQFKDNNHGLPMSSSTEKLAAIAKRVLGASSVSAQYLSAAHTHFSGIREERNENLNYRGRSDSEFSGPPRPSKLQNQTKCREIVRRTDPTDESSLAKAIHDFEQIERTYDLRDEFFADLRAKVPFGKRAAYIQNISALENVNLYIKLDELRRCKQEWTPSSAALQSLFKTIGVPLVKRHTEDLVSFGSLAGGKLMEISELSSLPVPVLALEAINLLAERDTTIPAAVWLGLACFVCEQAREGEGQAALTRLLGSDAARLSSGVVDGPWKEGLYPGNEIAETCSGFVWRMLGSPVAADRWRAAHSVRCFAKFERWNVIDALVGKLGQKHAHPFQAPELPFYFMHAKLWLLIALARVALEDPKAIAKYEDALIAVTCDQDQAHVIMKYFAARALLSCADAGAITFSDERRTLLDNITSSSLPRSREAYSYSDDFYRGRPSDAPEAKEHFHLDYDFHKFDVQGLSRVFGKAGWEVQDIIADIVRSIDPKVESMFENARRKLPHGHQPVGMTPRYHTYGQQLAWHALFLTADRLLRDCPVRVRSYDDDDHDSWSDWLGSYLLTRKDGLWLSEGIDWAPYRQIYNLLEKDEDGLVITGLKSKILGLVDLADGPKEKVIVSGDWHSADDIKVRVSSVFVHPGDLEEAVNRLLEDEPAQTWLPPYSDDELEASHIRSERGNIIPWLIHPPYEGSLDQEDPIGSINAVRRPMIAKLFADRFGIVAGDPFGRTAKNKKGDIVALSQFWGRESDTSDDSGLILSITTNALKTMMEILDAGLLVLIRLERCERSYDSHRSKYTHTVGVVHVSRKLESEYYPGRVNHPHTWNI